MRRRLDSTIESDPDDLVESDLNSIRLPPFSRRVYEVVRTIPAGATLSYGDVAALAGAPGAARAVGNALAKNPFDLAVPCHRVVGSDGRIGGYSGPGGVATKVRLLASEGLQLTNGRVAQARVPSAKKEMRRRPRREEKLR
jgi:methylated-DNA-[protein]-cysteine S-methyltransferase